MVTPQTIVTALRANETVVRILRRYPEWATSARSMDHRSATNSDTSDTTMSTMLYINPLPHVVVAVPVAASRLLSLDQETTATRAVTVGTAVVSHVVQVLCTSMCRVQPTTIPKYIVANVSTLT